MTYFRFFSCSSLSTLTRKGSRWYTFSHSRPFALCPVVRVIEPFCLNRYSAYPVASESVLPKRAKTRIQSAVSSAVVLCTASLSPNQFSMASRTCSCFIVSGPSLFMILTTRGPRSEPVTLTLRPLRRSNKASLYNGALLRQIMTASSSMSSEFRLFSLVARPPSLLQSKCGTRHLAAFTISLGHRNETDRGALVMLYFACV